MPRYRLLIEYDGAPFVGWQRQVNGPSVQQALEEAAERLTPNRPADQPVRLHAAGRTDAGVHALGMVAHMDLPRVLPGGKLADALNALTRPAPIAVLEARVVADTFHARFSCIERRYLYRLLTRRATPALARGRVWWIPRDLDAEAMRHAARRLVGHHDFSSFRAAACQADSPVKTLDALDVARVGDEIHVTARARSFLHHQVRNLVGTLALVGEGKWSDDDVGRALAARDRAAAGPTAPAGGLYFLAARYPDDCTEV
ncbi:tRNA pseudouridine(38-40) synthase TruA [Roseospira visakhapatnamensis]|uniref:tRNA pseudouridine synthase A n=1 Tax=Roseospira visakhapatnamensis TaxID=390880 RepID=A0A7W6WA67_9PROT|nr:tRNA pseudouridine(38-40) synthase TruA [Roseospira visakhapatnamensis]MBB4266538.1 tRNA pseudouridine38-40 synthase [Roseospira visakhapatnamensis]